MAAKGLTLSENQRRAKGVGTEALPGASSFGCPAPVTTATRWTKNAFSRRVTLLYRPLPRAYKINRVSIWIVNPEFSVTISGPRMYFA